jgi:hypothetical protein
MAVNIDRAATVAGQSAIWMLRDGAPQNQDQMRRTLCYKGE